MSGAIHRPTKYLSQFKAHLVQGGGFGLSVILLSILCVTILGIWAGLDFIHQRQLNAMQAELNSYEVALNRKNQTIEELVRSRSKRLSQKNEFKAAVSELIRGHEHIQRAELRSVEGQLVSEFDRALVPPIWPVLSRVIAPPNQLLVVEQSLSANRVTWSRSWAANGESFIEMIIPLNGSELAVVLISPAWSLLPPFSGIQAELTQYQYGIGPIDTSTEDPLQLRLKDLNLAITISPKSAAWLNDLFQDPRGKLIGIIGLLLIFMLIKNLIDSRNHQRTLRLIDEQARALEKSSQSQALNELASTLAHEINQPLTTIVNLIATCEIKVQSNAESPQAQELNPILTQARHEAMRAADIVKALRSWFKSSTMTKETVAISAVLEKIKPILDYIGQQHQAQISLIDSSDAQIKTDPLMFELVILNLVKNGLEAMASTPIPNRQITLRSEFIPSSLHDRQTPVVQISVKDQGAGIDEEIESRILDFSFTTKSNGMGIGLSFCNTFAERMGGQLKWQKNPDQGMTFFLVLPISSPHNLT